MLNLLRLLAAFAFASSGVPVVDQCTLALLGPGEVQSSRTHLTARRAHRPVALERSDDPRRSIQLYSFAIPVYRELYSGNLARLLRQIAAQTIAPGRVHVVLVVNNTLDVALKPDHPTLVENRRTVAWLNEARASLPFHLDVVDETGGFPRNMGLLRNRAVFRALDITDVDPRRHVIVNFDADGTMPPDYLARLDEYYSHFALDAVIARRGQSVPSDVTREYLQAQALSEYRHLEFDVVNAMTFPHQGFSTPQITVRASVARELGGFLPLPYNEDVDFGQRLREHVTLMAPDVLIAQSDRARSDGFDAAVRTQLLTAFTREDGVERPELRTTSSHVLSVEYTTRLSHDLERAIDRGRLSATEGLNQFERLGRPAFADLDPEHGAFFKGELVGRFDVWRALANIVRSDPAFSWPLFPRALNSGLNEDRQVDLAGWLMTVLPHYLRGDELRRFSAQAERRRAFETRVVRARLADVRRLIRGEALDPGPTRDAFRLHLRRSDSALRRDVDDQIQRRRGESLRYGQRPTSEDTLLRALIERYPDFLDETFSDPWARQVQSFRLLNDWLLNAQTHPELFPGTETFLGVQRPR